MGSFSLKVSGSPIRAGRTSAMALAALLLLPTACVTPREAPSSPAEVAGADKGAGRPARSDVIGDLLRGLGRLEESERTAADGPPASAFIGKPVAALDRALGAPALVRKEGSNEWRRYDLGDCRAYAVVVPAGGNVTSLSTGPSVAGAPVPRFETCRPPAPGA